MVLEQQGEAVRGRYDVKGPDVALYNVEVEGTLKDGQLDLNVVQYGNRIMAAAVAAAPGAASVRVWEVMSRGRGPRGGRGVPEGANVALALFVVGYGPDKDERFRNLPYVARLG